VPPCAILRRDDGQLSHCPGPAGPGTASNFGPRIPARPKGPTINWECGLAFLRTGQCPWGPGRAGREHDRLLHGHSLRWLGNAQCRAALLRPRPEQRAQLLASVGAYLPQSLDTNGVKDILAPVAESAHWTELSSS
jgi:hypothetical protein